MASLSERQRDILGRVRAAGHAEIGALARLYDVSPQTIRRDVNALCAADALRRVHGGVELPRQGANLHYASRRSLNEGAKRAIAEAFAALIPSGVSLAASIGTTPSYAIQALEGQRDLTILTNNLNVAICACDRESWQVQLPGGTVRPDDRDILGPGVEAFFARYQVDFGVFGVGGVAEDGTLLDFTEEEVAARRAIAGNCRRSVLLLDRTKFGRPAHVRGGHLTEVDHVICDAPLPGALAAALAARGGEMTITGEAQ
ncbi:DeoR/GlpR family DNA-binding transcription regulator [Acidimangrovimonas pyrenivorans]